MRDNRIYDPGFVSGLFDRMSSTYGITNLISSFGFSAIWRRQCVRQIPWHQVSPRPVTLDLMSGMGECWHLIRGRSAGKIIGIDFSAEMVKRSLLQRQRQGLPDVRVLQEDVLHNSLPNEAADVIISSFGLKTFNDRQLRALASEIHRLLRPGGTFSFIEISVPEQRLLRFSYMFYLKKVIPLIGKYFANDAYSYRFPGVYTAKFQHARAFAGYLADAGLKTCYRSYFFRCATGVVGSKPIW